MLQYDDFYIQLEQHLDRLNDQAPLHIDDPRALVFQHQSYFAVSGQPIAQGTFNPTCWAAHFPLHCIAYHDDWGGGNPNWPDYGSTTGNAVAITRRHAITTEHGREFTNLNLVWLPDQVRLVVGQVTSVSAAGIGDPLENLGGFRVYYLSERLPANYVCPMMFPEDTPQHEPVGAPGQLSVDAGLPMLTVDQFLKCWIQGIASYSELDGNIVTDNIGTIAQRRFLFGRTHEGKLWRQMFGGDSGSPLFLMWRNQQLYYYGHMTEGKNGVVVQKAYNKIIEACQILNDRHAAAVGETEHFVPEAIFHNPTRGPRPGFFRPPPSGPLG